jgi:hypothetical protein
MFPELIDASLLAAFKSCPELCNKGYIQHWKSKVPSVHLHAGGAFAAGMEAARSAYYVRELSAEAAILEGRVRLADFYGDFATPTDSAKTKDRMLGAFDFYFAHYPLDRTVNEPIVLPGGKRGIELSFAEPLPIPHPESGEPLIYVGRADAILNFAGGRFITDEKTTTQLGASWSKQWDLRSQFTGYCWLARKASIPVTGALIRGVSILKTKYETQQAVTYRDEWITERWYREMLLWVEDLVRCYKTGQWRHNFDHACADFGGCGFRSCCASHDETPWLTTHFERRQWNPLLRTETKLD